ncbi:MAG: type II toxin-antitoxin system PemK/MazF family toxin [Candidatus Ornithomonoglobus sp.]
MTSQKAIQLKNNAFHALEGFLNEMISDDISKSAKLSYWINDYVDLLSAEKDFNPSKLKKYKRGDIIKVHLGFRIGSEEGGLHYCVVLDKDNSIHSPTLTVIPLTSVKPNRDIAHLPCGKVYLGNEIYSKITEKLNNIIEDCLSQVTDIALETMPSDFSNQSEVEEKLSRADSLIEDSIKKKILYAKKILNEIDKLKQGSIALVDQITTISKLRIYDPKSSYGVLHKIRLSDQSLDLIDAEIKKIFMK